ncbi:hypothetical protein CPB83DRAFT_845740 [Crepidotus variabilis]|uniref:MYND-type domain-containing protein n=1 Tax=Crepidotus variabilis TaxID=179855 RepID=A0A9P6EQH3_9AGAR|nr:hypothetical protein CPB83DRAFT_845740 [Crepidotus variabilis]
MSEDYAQIITHTPQQAQEWKQLALSNPNRVARTLVLRPGRTTREGDNQGDIYPALEAVKAISLQGRRGAENQAWANLVLGGIADALCKNVIEMVVHLESLPNMPQDLLQNVKNNMRSPYYTPLEILCNASVNFQYPPTKTDKMVIAALRKNWSEMLDRIWNEPENTLRPEDSHTLERVVIAQMLLRIIITDPTFISVLYDPSDLTIQTIARDWKFSQREGDTMLTATTLCLMLEPEHPRQIAYVKSNGLESSTHKILSKILLGVASTRQSSKQMQVKTLLATFAEHLARFAGVSGRGAADDLNFLMSIIDVAKKNGTEPEVAKAVLKATPLWNAIFRLLKRSARPAAVNDEGNSGLQDVEEERTNRLRAIANIIVILANTLHDATFEHPRECEPLVRIWANENLFGAVEETIEILVTMPRMPMQLTRLFSIIDTTTATSSPALLRLLKTQFPRWKIIGTLVRHDVQQQQITGPPHTPPPGVMAPPESGFWNHGLWQCFGNLQLKCMDKTLCGKRGCDNLGTITCMCGVVKYCSDNCKTKDEKDHKLACGFMGLLDNIDDIGNAEAEVQPESPLALQASKGKKKKKKPQASSGSGAQAAARLEEVD